MDTRVPLIAGNWKMFKTAQEAADTAAELVKLVADASGVEVMIAPPYTALSAVSPVVAKTNVALGAQNLFWETEGAYTGEIAPAMLTSVGCSHVIIGHSERRQYFNETDATVNKRITAALKADLIPVMCIGETESERDADQTFSVLDTQIQMGLEGFAVEDLDRLVIAYEPVWAIGTGKAATPAMAQEVHAYVRTLIEKIYGSALANSMKILYGGSVKPANVKELMAQPDLDGALVGGASLDAATFSQLVHFNRE